jgi:CRISPR-associated protein, NE0113 family
MKYKRRVLVAVTGMSPQILTETVYALYTQQNWLPDEIFVLTTQTGYNNIVRNLLGEDGFFTRLCKDYNLPEIQFGERNIHVIHDADGEKLSDIRTPEENNLAADMIVNFIRQQCADDKTELHVSIAGGRKSMGFYIGYALSLFGRPQDKLSHVLVTEGFENNPLFFYPTHYDNYISKKPYDPNCTETINTREAKVMQAEIPFVRMSYGLPNLAQNNVSYSEAVQLLQNNLKADRIILNIKDCTIQLGQDKPIKIADKRYFFAYAALARFHLQNKSIKLINQATCYDNIKNNKWQLDVYPELDDFQTCYWDIMQIHEPSLKNAPNRQDLLEQARNSALQSLRELPSKLRTILTENFSEYVAEQYGVFSTGTRKTTPTYYLKMPAEKIEIVG